MDCIKDIRFYIILIILYVYTVYAVYLSILQGAAPLSHKTRRKQVNFRLPPSLEEQAKATAAMAKLILLYLKCMMLYSTIEAVFEDQVGKFDW